MRAMATSDTGSSFDQWSSGMYGYEGLPLGHADGGGTTTDSTIVTSAAAAAAAAVTSPTSAGSGDGSPGGTRRDTAGIQGPRVGKPAGRKRSRASRRAPVTLLNTDTANFRAMVQQFTGIPVPSPFSGAPGGGVPVISFAADYGFPPPAGVMSFDHAHHHQQQPSTFEDHQQLLRPHHHHHHQYTGGGAFGYSSSLHALAGDASAHGFGSAEEDKMLLQSMQQAAQMPFAASTANYSANGYFA